MLNNHLKSLTKTVVRSTRNFLLQERNINTPILAMTLLVKNEQDILEENLIFHRNSGIDFFIITNNNSTDKTSNIINKYYSLGWIKKVIFVSENNYNQVNWVNSMIEIARDFGANWVINSDADEFWMSKDFDLKRTLSNLKVNVIECKVRNSFYSIDSEFYKNIFFYTNKVSFKKIYSEDSFGTLFANNGPGKKVIHRTKGFISIMMGNHEVSMERKTIKTTNEIAVLHFPYRGVNHFKKKIIESGKALMQKSNLKEGQGEHILKYYRKYLNGSIDFENEYNKVIGKEYFNYFLKNGNIVKDERLYVFFRDLV